MKKLICILVLLFTTLTCSADSWTGRDKQEHLLVGIAIGTAVTFVTSMPLLAVTTGTLIGGLKEYSDYFDPEHECSLKDFLVTVLGTLFGTFVIFFIYKLSKRNNAIIRKLNKDK